MIFWPCCCSSCFKPCDCFLRNCELHITSEGWTDNAATDCAGIADRVFNKTHVITGMNVTSGPEYGFTCDFTISYDDLILTKEVGGNCICKSQPALYTIEGTLACARGEDGDYGLSMVLHFKVPVYDEDEGCSPSPCVLEPKWETWTANYTLISGNLTSSPICDFGANGLGPYSFNTEPSAQTTCGLGLDGTDATVTLEWKFCDPKDTSCCSYCCGGDGSNLPDTVSVTVSGVTNDLCTDCANFDGTYVIERLNGRCYWQGSFDIEICGIVRSATVTFSICGFNSTGLNPTEDTPGWDCSRVVSITAINAFGGPINLLFVNDGSTSGDPCPGSLDGLVLDGDYTLCPTGFVSCCDDLATATIGIPA